MADTMFSVVALMFFALCAACVRGLNHLVRSPEEADEADDAA